ncbi:MAG: hypothetical protein ACI9GJ_000420 [Parasphingorhabdus sp.]
MLIGGRIPLMACIITISSWLLKQIASLSKLIQNHLINRS